MIQPFVRKFMENYVLSVISTRPAAVQNDGEIWRFNSQTARFS